jgi:hypothetical protein
MKILSKIELLLIGLWLGAAVFFSLAVAPSVFSVLPSRELAGFVVNRTLTIVNISGAAIGVILLFLSFIPRGEAKAIWVWLQRILLVLVIAACGAGQAIIGFYLDQIRAMSGSPISELAADNPIKLQFDMWHQYSVWVLIGGMVAATLAFFIISRNYSGSTASAKKDDPLNFDLPPELKL